MARLVYDLEGSLLEACSCDDVSGLTFINICDIPGNVLTPGSWRVVSFVDRADDAQHNAILDAYHGRLGGPLADLAGLVGEVVSSNVLRSPTRSAMTRACSASGTLSQPKWSRSAAPIGRPSRRCGTRSFRPSRGRPHMWVGLGHTGLRCPSSGCSGRRDSVRLPHHGYDDGPSSVPVAIAIAWGAAIAVHITGHADAIDHNGLLATGHGRPPPQLSGMPAYGPPWSSP